MTGIRTAIAIRTASVLLLALGGAARIAAQGNPATAVEDVSGQWRAVKDHRRVITIGHNGNQLTLTTSLHDWKASPPTANGTIDSLHFERLLTKDDIKNMKLDDAQKPAPQSVIDGAAGKVKEEFNATLTWQTSCELLMRVRWKGFHLKWNDDGSWNQDGSPEETEDFELAPASYKNRWLEKAAKIINQPLDSSLGSRRKLIERNAIISDAYEDMYSSNPKVFKWAGMAEHASRMVGDGMQRALDTEDFALEGADHSAILSLADKIGNLHRLGGVLFRILAEGNLKVFADIYWQHLAYRSCGFKEIERIYNAGGLDKSLYFAWKDIDFGVKNNNPDLVWKGNAALLKYEQERTLQPAVYDPWRKLWEKISSTTLDDKWISPIDSPVPGDTMTFQKYQKELGNSPDLSDFSQRWAWIENSMLPAWKKVSGSP